jgi:hypothetical protein
MTAIGAGFPFSRRSRAPPILAGVQQTDQPAECVPRTGSAPTNGAFAGALVDRCAGRSKQHPHRRLGGQEALPLRGCGSAQSRALEQLRRELPTLDFLPAEIVRPERDQGRARSPEEYVYRASTTNAITSGNSPCQPLVYAEGAYGFFALPYTIIVYPFVFTVMPVLWRVAKTNGYVTAADVVHGRYGSLALELAVAVTGVIAALFDDEELTPIKGQLTLLLPQPDVSYV